MLVAKNLRMKYPNSEKKIFDGLDLTIHDKEKVLLLGPSGAGKSTLLNVLSGIVPDLIDLPMKYDELSIDKHCGVIFQDPDNQFCMPQVNEELAFVLENRQVPRSEMDAQIDAALNAVNLNIDQTQYVNQLSGGMKQKLAIVETILQRAQTLFLDEPTAMLDKEATESLWRKIKDVWHDQTVLIVEHKVEHIWDNVDRVILINYDGKIVADDTPTVILKQHEDLLTEYGVWHPHAWEHAPSPTKRDAIAESQPRFQFIDGHIKRGKETLISIDDLKIGSGEWITVTGSNGAGKTTLLESMMQLLKYDGTMTYEGQQLRKVKDVAGHVYLVYQNPDLQFITNSVYEEIYIQYKDMTKTQAETATADMLETLDLTRVKDQHPFELSVGQKRRLSVATAMSSNADIILLDEPTFGLDSHNTFNLIRLFQQRVENGQTIVMITHDPEIIRRYPTRQLHITDKQLQQTDKPGEYYV